MPKDILVSAGGPLSFPSIATGRLPFFFLNQKSKLLSHEKENYFKKRPQDCRR